MAYSIQQLEAAAINAASQFPAVAQFIQAGDPRVLAQLRAQAAMLAMISAQVDVAQFEPFVKARDATVLADATLKGVLPLSRAARVYVEFVNNDDTAFALSEGRRLIDGKGRVYMVDSAVSLPPGGKGTVVCVQRAERVQVHTVTADQPFYRIEVEQTPEPVFLNSLTVWRRQAPANVRFRYAPDWFNVSPGELAYQVETDERRRMWVQFGSRGVIGEAPMPGDVFELRIMESSGVVDDLRIGEELNLEYTYSQADARLRCTLVRVEDTGSEPHNMAELRIMARYPAIYDHNAVYLGEFAFLLRRYISNVRFLSVWNEQIEEAVRGANVGNINRLFVAGLVTDMSDADFRNRCAELIRRADNSYRITFVDPIPMPVMVTVVARVAVVHDLAGVQAQVRSVLLANYSDGAPAVSEGMRNPIRQQAVYRLLRDQVPALQDELSDYTVRIDLPARALPEHFLQMSDESISISVVHADHSTGLWNY